MSIKSNRSIWGKPFPVGGEWDAGYIRLEGGRTDGFVFVRRTETAFEVVRRKYHPNGVGENEVVKAFPVNGLTDDEVDAVEVEAKAYALDVRNALSGV